MSRCTKPFLLSSMPVTLTLPAEAKTAVLARSDCSRLYDATQLDATPLDPFTRRRKLIWDSTRSGITLRKFRPPPVDTSDVGS
jgi:hypothetical protein